LKTKLEELRERLNNVTSSKLDLEGQLGKVKIDLDGLKSNTSRFENKDNDLNYWHKLRLEGEKKGLEKVLEVKTEVDADGEEEDESGKKEILKEVIGLKLKKKKKVQFI